jgi:hypothetical protein
MFFRGLLLIGLALLCWAGTQVPMFGIGFLWLMSDLLFAGVAFAIAGLLPIRTAGRVAVALILWIGAAVSLDLERLPQHLSGFGGVLAPQVRHHYLVQFDKSQPLPLAGDINPFVHAAGPAGFARAYNIELLRMLLVNDVNTVEPVDMVWKSGFTPVIGAAGYPRLTIHRTVEGEWVQLRVAAESAPGRIAAEFRRMFPVAPEYPGVRAGERRRFIASLRHDSILREVLGLNKPVLVQRELSEFLGTVLGTNPYGVSRGPVRGMQTVADSQVPLPTGASPEKEVQAFRTRSRADPVSGRLEVCGMPLDVRRFGTDGYDANVRVLEASADVPPVILFNVRPGNRAFDAHCEPATQRMLTFVPLEHGVLRVAGYARDGRLVEVHYFEPKFREYSQAAIDAASFQRGPRGELRFALVLPMALQTSPRMVFDPRAYRRVEFAGAPL